MYDLFVTGITDLNRYTGLFQLRKVVRDPLSGVVDSVNKVFFTTYQPLLTSGSTAVYIGATLQSAAGYSLYPDTGEIDFTTAPTAQVYANYLFSTLTLTQIKRVLLSGFDEMESRWARSLRLASSSSAYAAADEDSANAYIVPRDSVIDPLAGDDTFSTQRVQQAFLMKCAHYAYLSRRSADEAEVASSYREASGMTVNTLGRVPNLERVLERLESELCTLMLRAQEAWFTDGRTVGAGVLDPRTQDYLATLEWQTDAKSRALRNTVGVS